MDTVYMAYLEVTDRIFYESEIILVGVFGDEVRAEEALAEAKDKFPGLDVDIWVQPAELNEPFNLADVAQYWSSLAWEEA